MLKTNEALWIKEEIQKALASEYYHKDSIKFNALIKTAHIMKKMIIENRRNNNANKARS